MIARVAVDRRYELVGSQIERAKRLVSHVAWQELNVRRFIDVRARVQVFATPYWTDQWLVGLGIGECAQLIDELPHYRFLLRSGLVDAVLVTRYPLDAFLSIVVL